MPLDDYKEFFETLSLAVQQEMALGPLAAYFISALIAHHVYNIPWSPYS